MQKMRIDKQFRTHSFAGLISKLLNCRYKWENVLHNIKKKKLLLCEVVLFSHVFIRLGQKYHDDVQYSAYCIY
jgi:hypothetical protein